LVAEFGSEFVKMDGYISLFYLDMHNDIRAGRWRQIRDTRL